MLGIIASACGYAMLWRSKPSFYQVLIWYVVVQLIQLSWMTSIEYQGAYILVVYGALCFVLSLFFATFSQIVGKYPPFALAAVWTLFEWGRFHFLCGFSWNLAGISLSSTAAGLQMASLFGILGMSFWVILTNLYCYLGKWKKFLILAAIPYLFGFSHILFHETRSAGAEQLAVRLVQTGLLPSEKVPLRCSPQTFISPFIQWKQIVSYLTASKKYPPGLIVLPEAAVPFGSDVPLYHLDQVKSFLEKKLGDVKLPPLQSPYARKLDGVWVVTNLFWAQALSNYFDADFIIGLDHFEPVTNLGYNAAFFLQPQQETTQRYEKRVLLPLAEYLPFESLRSWSAAYGITDFFTPGLNAVIFQGKHPYSASICYEETFPHLIREGRLKGAALFVNITSDSWYPFSSLPKQHFIHGRVRAVENGVPLVRACNTGLTAVVDSLGRTSATFFGEQKNFEIARGALDSLVSMYTYSTLYTFWGDVGIVLVSVCCLLILALKLRLR